MLGAIATFVLLPTASAQAHPLGNFTINHYNGLELHPDRLDVVSIVDSAEIPTAQELQSLAPDGSPTDDQLADAARTQCADLSTEVTASVDGQSLSWTVLRTNLESVPGAAGLPTLRLTCELRAVADFSQPRVLEFADGYRDDRVGWHEITADGVGVRLLDPPVGSVSTSDELRTYPTDLLFSPLDERSVRLSSTPGSNSDSGSSSGAGVSRSSGDPFSSLIATLDRFLEDLIGGQLTPLVGTLAVLLAVLLGAGHALLPGHGKTMIAAYLAARRGRSRDAVIVGATVTATHTAGVLLLGLAISFSSTLAGEDVLRWLGIISGVLVAGIGAYMLVGAVRNRRAVRRAYAERPPVDAPMALVGGPARTGDPHGLVHDHDQSNGHDHGHERAVDHDHGHSHSHDHGHGHDHSHDHEHERAVDHDHDHDHRRVRDAVPVGVASGGHSHGHADGAAHEHGHEHSHTHADGAAHEHSHGGSWWSGGHSHGAEVGRGGLIGMGVAGGLVPSPSALIVLVASIALGRTVFGVFLVIAYGLGMAATLTVAGLLLVRLRGRLDRRADRRNSDGSRSWLAAVSAALPIITATLVLVVGLGLALRGLLLGG